MSLDLSDYETKLVVRNLRPEDYEAVVALQVICFPDMPPWSREAYASQMKIFPEGQFGIELEGEIVASCSSLIVDYSDYSSWDNWVQLSDNGHIRNHDPAGDTLYGIEIMVHPEHRGMKLARRLYDVRKQLCRTHNLARMMIGGRIPGYANHKDDMTPQQYVERVRTKRFIDPVLTAQLANGFLIRQIVPDYLKSDEDSAGYATCLEWPNLDYRPAKVQRHRRAYEPIRVALVQYQMRPIKSWEDFEQQCTFFTDVASDHKSDFLLFPELFTLQLLSLVSAHQPGMAARALADFTPKYLELFSDLAVRYNVNIIGGTQFTLEQGQLFNVAYLFRRDGTLGKQYKIHITPSEAKWWGVQGGNEVHVFDTDRGPISILICYDVEFPELARVISDKGARVMFVPFNTNDEHGYLRVRICAHARCIENHMFAITAGCVGNLPLVENADIHYARSGVYTPADIPFAREGVAIEASPNLETVLVHDLDVQQLRRHQRWGTVQNWNDRRRDLYSVRYKEGESWNEV